MLRGRLLLDYLVQRVGERVQRGGERCPLCIKRHSTLRNAHSL